MTAALQERYGRPDQLCLGQVERPAVGDDDLVIRVHAAAVCRGDWHLQTGRPYLVRAVFGLRRPRIRIPGQGVAGRVEVVGRNVTGFEPGDAVFGALRGGAFAEYACASADEVVHVPANLTLEQAAAVPTGGFTALQGLRAGGSIEPGQDVLINGASGGVGSLAVQIARHFGARVTGVCSTKNVEEVLSLGAHDVIDYTREDFTKSDARFDLMLDLVGKRSPSQCRRVLKPKGTYVSSAGPAGDWIAPLIQLLKVAVGSLVGSQRMVSLLAKPNREDLLVLRELLASGAIVPVVGRRRTLGDLPDALRQVGEGHSRGTAVLTV